MNTKRATDQPGGSKGCSQRGMRLRLGRARSTPASPLGTGLKWTLRHTVRSQGTGLSRQRCLTRQQLRRRTRPEEGLGDRGPRPPQHSC